MRRLLATFSLFLLPFAFAAAADKPVPTTDAAAKMTVPPGFNVTLFAGEPDVVQPIAFTFDDRGRMWVVECLSYPKWRADGKGNDRVVILEDTDGDGVHDKKTVVLNNGVNLSGIEVGFDGVWLCSTPNLIFIPIKDDKPSGEPQVVLDGWNLKDAKHNAFNSLIWGPDGWLYGCNGIQTKSWVGAPGTPQDKRTYMDCGVWKYHPTRKVFEVVATGTTNPWGLDFDEHGEMFITNCVIDHLFHVVPGGRYQRMYGQDPNPYAFGLMGSAVDYKHWGGGHWTESRSDLKTGAIKKAHDDAGGGHAHSGCCIYLGDNFPKEYRNTLFTCNIHGNRLNNDGLERTASGMKGVRRPDFLFANDPWFRGICVKQGPEGALYVSDWCDTGECHNYDVADTTNGRIYRVAYGTPKKFAGDVAKMTDMELVELVTSKNEWLSRKARRVMQERAAAKELSDDARLVLRRRTEGFEKDEAVRLRAMWAIAAFGELYDGEPMRFINADESDVLRAWGVRLAGQAKDSQGYMQFAIDGRGRLEQSSTVRAAVAIHLGQLPDNAKLPLAKSLFSRPADNADDKLTQLYWLGVQPAALAKPDEALKLVNAIAIRRVRTNIVRLVLSLPNSDPTKQLDAVMPILEATADQEVLQDILTGILQAFEDRKQVNPPKKWSEVYVYLDAAPYPKTHELTESVALLFGDERAVVALKKRLTNPNATAEARQQAVERLVAKKLPGLAPLLKDLMADPAGRPAAIRGLAAFADDDTPALLLKAYPSLTADEKADAVLTLAARPAFALALLTAVEKGTVPKGDITAFVARQIVALNNKDVTAKLGTVWGTVKAASATRAEQTKKLKALLTPDYLKAADAVRGKTLFTKSCATCHKLFNEGGDVGPDLTGSQRGVLDYVLENVLDPNAVVPFDYKMVQFNLLDGRVVTGLMKKETAQAVTVRTANEQIVIAKEDIEKRTPTNNSVMPEGLLDALKDEEIRDLVAYLQKK